MGTRQTVKSIPPTTPKPKRRPPKRSGSITDVEKSLVTQFVLDQPAEMTTTQVNSLAKAMRRSREVVQGLVEDAREQLVSSAKDYVEMHKQVVQQGLADGSPKGLEVALKGTQWAMENISEGGKRIVDKAAASVDATPRIVIGIKLGGIDESKVSTPKVELLEAHVEQ